MNGDRDGAVVIETRYGLEGLEFELRLGAKNFLHIRPSQPWDLPSLL